MNSRARTFLVPIAALTLLVIAPVASHAQGHDHDDRDEDSFAFSRWAIGARGGIANFGRFLLEDVFDQGGTLLGQRKLDASNAFVYGGGVAATVIPRTTLRLGFIRTSADLEYNDDSGTGSSVLDLDDVGGISSNVVTLEVIRHVLSHRAKIRPYGGAGIATAWWNLSEDADDLVVSGTGDNTLFKWGANALLGLEFRPSRRWAIHLEANTMTLGNPFTGDKSFVTTTGTIIDEPSRVRQTNFMLGIAYTFGQVDRRFEADR